MNYSKALFIVNDDIRAVKIQYDPAAKSNEYDYVKTFDRDVKVDDMIVVQSGTRHKMTTAKVVEIDCHIDVNAPGDMKWMVCVVDAEPVEKLVEMEADAVKMIQDAEKRRTARELRQELFGDQPEKLDAMQIGHVAPATPPVEAKD